MDINDIASERIKDLKTSDSVIDVGISETEVELIADKLVNQLGPGSGEWRAFYCRVARTLPQGKIWQLVEIAKSKAKRSTGGYFMTIAYKEMGPIYKLGGGDEKA